MKKLVLSILSVAIVAIAFANNNRSLSDYHFFEPDNEPIADPLATVIHGNARFTVLTDRMIRMEWSRNAVFEDRASLTIVNRRLPVPKFTTVFTSNKVTIKTDALTLTYTGNDRFDSENLSVTFSMPVRKSRTKKVTWYPGADDSGNLMGTIRTLDGCEGAEKPNSKGDVYEKGILSRDGWAVIDDTDRHLLQKDASRWGEWVTPRPDGDRQDLYILAYGHDYKAALGDFTKVAGRIPLPPKYVFGYWWSRYWQYSDFEFIDLAKEIRSHGIPLDIMVVDMDWHDTYTLSSDKSRVPKDEFGQRIGWTGYTWQKQLFPDPEGFLADLHSLKLKTALNLHPASGIQPYEECYDRFVEDYTSRTDQYDGPEGYRYKAGDPTIYLRSDPSTQKAVKQKEGEKCPVPFRISQQAWADAYFNSVIHPLEKQGVDFWWLDWQQWKKSAYMKDLSITFWLNWCFFNDRASIDPRADRPLIYHRWGGLGSHRYQIGFSGDSYDTWGVLSFLPYFTATSSNVGYGYWGHDIGGHMCHSSDNAYKPETYTRWLQYGVFTPIFKTHSTKSAKIERRVWTYAPEYSGPMREAIRLRYSLSPYIYGAARDTYDTGVSICRPMYYDWPEDERAYSYKEQFMFGDLILASVIGTPVSEATGLASRKVWLPAGQDWYDMTSGRILQGGTEPELTYTINENPWFVKAGSIIPMAGENIMSLQEGSSDLTVFVAPGDGRSEYSLYEDDTRSQAYVGKYTRILFSKTSDASRLSLTVGEREGSFDGMLSERNYRFVFEGVVPPAAVMVDGVEMAYGKDWTYDGVNLAVVLTLDGVDAGRKMDVVLTFDGKVDREILRGKKGLFRRMMAITPEVKDCFNAFDSYKLISREFLKLAQCSSRITADPSGIAAYMADYDIDRIEADLASEVKNIPQSKADRKDGAALFFKKLIVQCRN